MTAQGRWPSWVCLSLCSLFGVEPEWVLEIKRCTQQASDSGACVPLLGTGTHKSIGVQQAIGVRHPEMNHGLNQPAKPRSRRGFRALFNLLLLVLHPFSRLQIIRLFIALKMKNGEGPNQAVRRRSSWPYLHPQGSDFLLWTRFVLGRGVEALCSFEFGLYQYPREVYLQIREGSISA